MPKKPRKPRKPKPQAPGIGRVDLSAPGYRSRSVHAFGRAFMVPDPTLTPALRAKLCTLFRAVGMLEPERLEREVQYVAPPEKVKARIMYGPGARREYREVEMEPGPPLPPPLPEPLLAVALVIADLRAMRDNKIDAANPWRDVPPKLERLARACDEVLHALADVERDPYAPSALRSASYGDSRPSHAIQLKRGALFIGADTKRRLAEWRAIPRPKNRRKALSAHEAVRDLAGIWTRETGKPVTYSYRTPDGGPFVKLVHLTLRGAGLRMEALPLVRAYVDAMKRGAKRKPR